MFEHEGKERIAFLSAGNSLAATAHGDSLWLLGLDGTLGPADAPGTGSGTEHAGEEGDTTNESTGATVWDDNCAVCHGVSAKGDGPLAAGLRFRPSDLTRIAARDGGKFDAVKVHRIIDGRNQVKGHGGPDMPVWGDVLLTQREGYDKDKVKEQIRRVVHYLASIQDPPPTP